MKKSIFLTLLLAAFFVVGANPVDVSTAKETGKKFLHASTNIKSTENLQLVSTYNIDRGDAAFYVFSNDNGFVIVAADDCAKPILAYSDEGSFDMENIPIQMQDYLYGFVEQIEYCIVNNIAGYANTDKTVENRNTHVVGPLLKSSWDQNKYYNRKCPVASGGPDGYAYAGCVATAMGQIMYYYKKPVTGHGSHTYTPAGFPTQTANFGQTNYDWNNMVDKLTSTSTTTQIDAVATLLWHCGISVDMMYGAGGSGAYSTDAPYAFTEYFDYSDELRYDEKDRYDDLVWLARIKASLDLGRPVYYSGTRVKPESGAAAGHAFVCDGYDDGDMLHFNWGWSGSNNCYCAVNAVGTATNHYYYNNGAIFNIHPRSETPTLHNVSLTANDTNLGSVSESVADVQDGNEITITATAKGDNVFCYWSENGGIVSNEAEYTFKVYYSRNIQAVFAEPDNIAVNVSVYGDTGGTVSGGGNYSYGTTAQLSATPSTGYTFFYWLDGTNIVSSDNPYDLTVTGNRNLTARFVPDENVCELIFTLDDFYKDGWNGNTLNVNYEKTFTESLEPKVGTATSFARKVQNGSQIDLSWTLGLLINECRFSLKYGNGVVFYDKPSVEVGYSDTFNVKCDGSSDIVFNGNSNASWSNTANWASGTLPASTSIADIKSDADVDVNVTIKTLNLYDDVILTVKSGKKLTVTGTIAQLPGSKIVIEDGGQLVNLTQGISGTVQKDVINWTTTPYDNGWYAVSTPVDNLKFEDVTNLTNATAYNVYRYNEATATWENCQYEGNLFDDFDSGRGYLYRRNEAATLGFNGVFNTSYVGYPLSYTTASGSFKGFHLIGNPYTHNIYKGANTAFYNYNYLEDGFYTLQTNGTWQAGADNSTPIKPCEAILVQAKDFVTSNYIMFFVNTTASGVSKDAMNTIKFTVSNKDFEDVAFAVIKEGRGLNKIEHRNEDAQMLYIRHNGEDFAVADIDELTKLINLNFEAAKTGFYTLRINAEGGFRYLHLIDKFTGYDVDMLAEREYSFIGSPSDAAERFVVRIELSDSFDSSDNSIFAYQNGNDIVVSGEGVLQIFDVTGRMVSNHYVDGVETIRKPSQTGVYVLRLLGNDVKTQKVLIR